MSPEVAYPSLTKKIFRPAEVADIHAIADLQHTSYATIDRQSDDWCIDNGNLCESAALSIRKYIQEVDHFCFVALADEKIVGFIHFKPCIHHNRNGLQLEILIDSHFRSKGWGDFLMKRSIAFLSEQSNTIHLYLTVEKENTKAIKLYQKNGFTRIPDTTTNTDLYWIMSKTLIT